ncbi:hypothetical protein JKF63_02955 [Porcisia hertigi]|uniref:Uncharacterized protein n=1 Tax=Porcisia hertigi TaxID=2761500 RepID=A0A836LFW5_9TRYP|nr:hypothetical protein JKF63_02955 [Porcisia hertigi]
MGKRTPAKKSGASDTAKFTLEDDASANTASNVLSPRTSCQRKWAKRADEAVNEMEHVQELLQHHAAKVDALKRELEELTYTAAGLWAANPEELPLQYRDKQQQVLFRSNSPSLTSSRSNVTTPTKRRGAPDTSLLFPTTKSDAASGSLGPAPETVEQALLQLPPPRRAKVSAALQSLFYAHPSALSRVDATDGTGADSAMHPRFQEENHCAQQTPVRSSKSGKTASTAGVSPTPAPPLPAATSDAESSALATEHRNCIPQALFLAMTDLQARRIDLEAQLTKAADATTRQLQRFQLLQEEVMVSQYGLDAARRDVHQEIIQPFRKHQEFQQRALAESAPAPM